MRTLIFCMFGLVPVIASAQGFWAPGACWTYSNGLSNGAHHEYIGDTIVNGQVVQVCALEYCWIDDLGAYHCGGINEPFHEYTVMQGEALLYGLNSSTGLDTMYWLGAPGDRWWVCGSEENCLGYNGMMEIQDTGHVAYDGVTLRTWTVVRLQQDGTPYPWFAETITERIGSVPRWFCPSLCSTWTDCETFSLGYLEHYSDAEISIPDGTSCDLTTGFRNYEQVATPAMAHPNPGTDQLTLSGLPPGAFVEVRDPLGRLVRSERSGMSKLTMHTADWPTGIYVILVRGGDDESTLKWVKQ